MRRVGRESQLNVTGAPPCLPSPRPLIHLSNRFDTLKSEGDKNGEAMEDLPRREPNAKQLLPSLVTSSAMKERRVAVVGDSLLRGIEGPICRLDPSCQ